MDYYNTMVAENVHKRNIISASTKAYLKNIWIVIIMIILTVGVTYITYTDAIMNSYSKYAYATNIFVSSMYVLLGSINVLLFTTLYYRAIGKKDDRNFLNRIRKIVVVVLTSFIIMFMYSLITKYSAMFFIYFNMYLESVIFNSFAIILLTVYSLGIYIDYILGDGSIKQSFVNCRSVLKNYGYAYMMTTFVLVFVNITLIRISYYFVGTVITNNYISALDLTTIGEAGFKNVITNLAIMTSIITSVMSIMCSVYFLLIFIMKYNRYKKSLGINIK